MSLGRGVETRSGQLMSARGAKQSAVQTDFTAAYRAVETMTSRWNISDAGKEEVSFREPFTRASVSSLVSTHKHAGIHNQGT